MVTAKIITIGDELLLGQVADINSSLLARSLGAVGVTTCSFETIPDTPESTCDAVKKALEAYDIVITTGGLGPTKDDLTKEALAEMFHCKGCWRSEEQLEVIKAILHSRGLDALEENLHQADIPNGADAIVNKIGTAPILVFRGGDPGMDRAGLGTLYCMPGVPFETRAAAPDVMDDILEHHPELTKNIQHRHLMTFGIAESALSRKIASWEDALDGNMHLAYLPDPILGVRLRLTAFDASDRELDAQVAALMELIGEHVYAQSDTSLQEVIVKTLISRGQTLAAAESCTGGHLSHLITLVSGCSAIYKGSVTSYTNEIKMRVLGVPSEIIEKYTEVSPQCAEAMAQGVQKLFGTDYGVATTGFAGPHDEQPLVWIGIARPDGTASSYLYKTKSTRAINIDRFAANALWQLFQNL